MKIPEHNLSERALLEGAYLCAIIALCVLAMLLEGCGGPVSVQGDASVDGRHVSGSVSADDEEICGELKPRRFPVGLIVCYDRTGKARVCVTTDAGELACYERRL